MIIKNWEQFGKARDSEECIQTSNMQAFAGWFDLGAKSSDWTVWNIESLFADGGIRTKPKTTYYRVIRNQYGALEVFAEDEPFGKQPKSKTTPTPSKGKSQITIDKAHGRLKTVKKWIHAIGDAEFVNSKLVPDKARTEYDKAIKAARVCREELAKIVKTLQTRKAALTETPAAKKKVA